MSRAPNPLESIGRELLRAGMELGQRAIARAADQALSDAHKGVGRVAREWDRRVRRARERLADFIEPLDEEPEQDDWPIGR